MTPPSSPRAGEAASTELRGRIGSCVEHGSAAEFYDDDSGQCLYCCQVETSCNCTEARAGEAEGGVRQLADTIRRHLLMHADHRASDVWQENTVAMFDALLARSTPAEAHDAACDSQSRHGPPFDKLCDCRSTPAEALDVERLGRAIEAHLVTEWAGHGCSERCNYDIAAEYARLSPESDQ